MKILNFGSLNIDYTYRVDHFVKGGETLSSSELNQFSGGKGLNQSVALGRSGAEVWHAGAIGAEDGDFLVRQLREAGVHTDLISHLNGKTGHAIIQNTPDGENCILLYGGANQCITKEMADLAMESFGAGDYLVLQNEISQIGYIMQKAHEKQMKIVFNPSPMNEMIFTYPLEYVDYFLLNEVEAAEICARQKDCKKGAEKLSLQEAEGLLRQMSVQFPGAKIVLTLGSQGSLYRDGERIIRQKSYPVQAVDTTAAGDTFTGYLIGSLVKGMPAEAALDRAAKAAAIAVSRPGAAPSIPSAEETDTWQSR